MSLRCLKMWLASALVEIVGHADEWIAPSFDVVNQVRLQVLVHPSRPATIGMRLPEALVEHHQLFTFLKPQSGGSARRLSPCIAN